MINVEISDFWERVKHRIKEENTTQEWVASKSGINFGTFNNWIYHNRLPDVFQAQRIAETLGVTVEYLVGAEKKQDFFSEFSLTVARSIEKLSEEGKKAALASVQGLQSVYGINPVRFDDPVPVARGEAAMAANEQTLPQLAVESAYIISMMSRDGQEIAVHQVKSLLKLKPKEPVEETLPVTESA
jgi:transcriptional regulator with XRE-family HTH domain